MAGVMRVRGNGCCKNRTLILCYPTHQWQSPVLGSRCYLYYALDVIVTAKIPLHQFPDVLLGPGGGHARPTVVGPYMSAIHVHGTAGYPSLPPSLQYHTPLGKVQYIVYQSSV